MKTEAGIWEQRYNEQAELAALLAAQRDSYAAKISERKTVHQWLNAKGVPQEEAGKPMGLLRRLAIALSVHDGVRPLEMSDVRWEYEDQLPEMSDDEFAAIFKASRVDGVRLYPYVEDGNGNRIWITHIPILQATEKP